MEKALQNIKDGISDRIILQRVAAKGIFIIRQRTKKGIFLEGSSPGSDQYSTKPFAMPVGALNKMTGKKIAEANDESRFQLFKSKKTNNLWVIVKGGYAEIRKLANKNSDNVTMSWSSKTLRNLGVITDKTFEQTIGFSDERARKIAEYHNVLGAGKSKKKKIFMGASEQEVKQLVEYGTEQIVKSILKRFSNAN